MVGKEKDEQSQNKRIIDDRTIINSIIKLLNKNTEIEDHKCGDLASLTIIYEKKKIRLGILPSHNNGYIDIRYRGKIHQVNEVNFYEISVFKDFKKLLDNP